MDKFMQLMEKHLVPIAGKFANQRHLMSIRDAFVAMMPVTLAGSFATLLNVFARDLPNTILGEGNAMTSFLQPLIDINGLVWWGCLAIISLLFSFSLGYNLAKNNGVDPLPTGIVAVSVFLITVPQSFKLNTDEVLAYMVDSGEAVESFWGNIQISYFQATGLFTAMIFILLFIELYMWFIKRNFTIKMPDTVPPAVSKAFSAVIPGLIAIFGTAIATYIIGNISGGEAVNDIISRFIQQPLLKLAAGYPAVLLITLVTQVLWFFGLHGLNILTPIYESLWGVLQLDNISAAQNGLEIPNLWVRGSFDAYSTMGGSGVALGLLIAMFIFGRRKDTREIAKIAIGPGIFNINEPIVFGLPIVLNPMYIIPWVMAPVVCVTIGYFATVIGLVPPVIAGLPWIIPPVLFAFLATGGNLMAALVSLVCLIIAVFIWAPFVILSEKQSEKLYGKEEK